MLMLLVVMGQLLVLGVVLEVALEVVLMIFLTKYLGEVQEVVLGEVVSGEVVSGGFQQAPRRGANIDVTLRVSLAEAVEGCQKKLHGYGVDVKVPAGIASGQKLRLKGKGHQGPGGAGHLNVFIEVNVPKGAELENQEQGHLNLGLPITLQQAIRGGKVGVDLPEGGSIKLNLPAELSLPKKIRIPNRGMTIKGGRGHLYVRPYIVAPSLPEDESKAKDLEELLDKLAAFYTN